MWNKLGCYIQIHIPCRLLPSCDESSQIFLISLASPEYQGYSVLSCVTVLHGAQMYMYCNYVCEVRVLNFPCCTYRTAGIFGRLNFHEQ